MAFYIAFFAQDWFPLLPAYLLTPSNAENRSGCVGWSILNIAWRGGGGRGAKTQFHEKLCRVPTLMTRIVCVSNGGQIRDLQLRACTSV